MKIALLGAESTGKTRLAGELATVLRRPGRTVAVVPEALRAWCSQSGRMPLPHEQLPLARAQERQVDEAAGHADIVIADTTALMVAVYSALASEASDLLRFALERQRGYDCTLLTGLDLPWVPDGAQREGPAAQRTVDARLRELLARAAIPYRVVYGTGDDRVAAARAAVASFEPAARTVAGASPPAARRWRWVCDTCSDPACEHQLLAR